VDLQRIQLDLAASARSTIYVAVAALARPLRQALRAGTLRLAAHHPFDDLLPFDR
jgi:hypothetical protein